MSESAALSVLVLAWNEAAPAVRTVLEAAPAVGSLLVLLPPVGPPPAAPAGAATAPAPAPATAPTPATTAAAVSSAAHAAAPAAGPAVAGAGAGTASAAALPRPPAQVVPAATLPGPATSAAETVRLVYLTDAPLPLPVRNGAFRVPAAPYLGASSAASPAPERPALAASPTSASHSEARAIAPTLPAPLSATGPAAPVLAAEPAPLGGPALVALVPVAPPPALASAGTPSIVPAASAPAVPDVVPALADAAFRAEEILDADPEQELHPAPLPTTPAATRADSPALRDFAPAASAGPFGMRIPARQPAVPDAPRPAPAPAPEEEQLPPEPAAPAPLYAAPDLNTQVIRYARQAVPTALAAGSFEAIYAPAWPTWLAALELRQRSGRPLVLHLLALAAGRQPADTAAGWPAEMQRQALRQADMVLVETYALARRLRRELGLAGSTVRVVPAHDAGAIARALRRARRP